MHEAATNAQVRDLIRKTIQHVDSVDQLIGAAELPLTNVHLVALRRIFEQTKRDVESRLNIVESDCAAITAIDDDEYDAVEADASSDEGESHTGITQDVPNGAAGRAVRESLASHTV